MDTEHAMPSALNYEHTMPSAFYFHVNLFCCYTVGRHTWSTDTYIELSMSINRTDLHTYICKYDKPHTSKNRL